MHCDSSAVQAWSRAYGLDDNSSLPPKTLNTAPEWMTPSRRTAGSGSAPEPRLPPPAPHLQDCASLNVFQQTAERRGPKGEMPWWNERSNCSEYAPDPPWVSEMRRKGSEHRGGRGCEEGSKEGEIPSCR